MALNSRYRPSAINLLCALMVLAMNSSLNADTFQIVGAGTISGTILNDEKSAILKIRTNDGIVIEIPSGRIKLARVSAEFEQEYKAMVAKEETAELHRAISQTLNPDHKYLSIAHKERLVELQPSDENWGALGYFKDPKTGEWVRRDFINKRKGMLNVVGKWDTPESQAIVEAEKRHKVAEGSLNNLIEQQRKNLSDGGPKRQKAVEFFDNLNDKLAIKKIYDLLLKDANFERTERYMQILTKMPGNSASPVFVDIAMNPQTESLRAQAIELLERNEASREFAFNHFLSIIGNPKSPPPVVDRAGSNLQNFVDKRAIPTLIDRLLSLVTKTTIVPGNNAINTKGNVAMSTGPEKYETKTDYRHQTVLSALTIVSDGANWQYDQSSWWRWYAEKFAKTNLDLRRDE